MHPPPFHLDHLLSDWPECRFEIRCACGRSSLTPTGLLRSEVGDLPFRRLLPALKCSACGSRPAPVYLLAGQHREHCYGGAPGWAIELVPAPR